MTPALIDLVQRVAVTTVRAWWRDHGMSMTWGYVTSVSPLRVRPTSQNLPLDSTPESLVSGLSVGDRVLMARFGTAWVVIGAQVSLLPLARGKMVKTAEATYVANVWLKVTFNSSEASGVTVSPADGTFTVETAGRYDLFLHQKWQFYGTAYSRSAAAVKGTAAPDGTNHLGLTVWKGDDWLVAPLVVPDVDLAVGDVITFWIRGGTGGTFNATGGTGASTFATPTTFAVVRKVPE